MRTSECHAHLLILDQCLYICVVLDSGVLLAS
jgi:hypothetical protein